MSKMKEINSFDDALQYVHRLGFAGSGNIVTRQSNLCDVTDLFLKASGQISWYQQTFEPFKVRFKPYRDSWGKINRRNSRFEILLKDGSKYTVYMTKVVTVGWIKY
jgi:hypothetical protein